MNRKNNNTVVSQGKKAGLLAAAAVALTSAQGADPAYGQLELFSAAFSKVRAEYAEPVKDSELVEGAIQGMVTRLDPHSSYMTAKAYAGEFEITTRGHLGETRQRSRAHSARSCGHDCHHRNHHHQNCREGPQRTLQASGRCV